MALFPCSPKPLGGPQDSYSSLFGYSLDSPTLAQIPDGEAGRGTHYISISRDVLTKGSYFQSLSGTGCVSL